MQLPDSTNVFDIECDVSRVGINGIHSQHHPIAYFSEKINETKQKYLTYDNKFYMVI